MSKEDYIKKRAKKTGADLVELKEKWQEFEDDAKSFGVDNIEGYVKKRIASYYAKLERMALGEFKGVILGIEVGDFGAKNLYEKHKKFYAKDPAKAIDGGFVDSDGNPLYLTPDWKEGHKIIPEEAMQLTATAIAKGEDDDGYKLTTINAGYKHLEKDYPTLKLVNFKSWVNKKKSDDKSYTLSVTEETKFDVEKDLSQKEVEKLIGTYFKDSYSKIANLKGYLDSRPNDKRPFVVVRGDVTDIIIVDEGKRSNVLILNSFVDDDEFDMETPTVSCFMPKQLDIDFDNRAQDVLVIGKVSENDKGDININALSVFCPDEFKSKNKPEEIKPEPKEEKEDIGDTKVEKKEALPEEERGDDLGDSENGKADNDKPVEDKEEPKTEAKAETPKTDDDELDFNL